MTLQTASKISNALRALQKNETKTSVIRDTFQDIEGCRAAGITNKQIAETLTANGLEIDEKSLASLLSRERRQRKRKNKDSTIKKEKTVENV